MCYIFLLLILIAYFKAGFILSNAKYVSDSSIHSYSIDNRKYSAPKMLHNTFSIMDFEDKFDLNCRVEGSPEKTKIKWFINSPKNNYYDQVSEIFNNETFQINSDGNLQFPTNYPDITTNFFCSASNEFGTVLSRKLVVPKISLPKNIIILYKTNDIIPNEKAVFTCQVEPSELMEYFSVKHWEIRKQDNAPFIVTRTYGRFSVINVTKVPQLHIRNVTKEEFTNMEVRCVLVIRFSAKRNFETSVWSKPREYLYELYFSDRVYDTCKGSELNVMQGTDVELPMCSNATSVVITWHKSNSSSDRIGQPITLDNHKYQLISSRYCNLLIKNIEISDEGFYFVKEPSSKVPRFFKPFELRVTVRLGLEISPADAFVAYGSTIEFRCTVTGYPVTNVFWVHNGQYQKTLEIARTDMKTIVTKIVITNVNESSTGAYQCVAESRDGTGNSIIDSVQHSAAVMINEMSPRLILQSPPVPSIKSYATLKLTSSSSNVIQCSFNATPKATIQWYLDDEPIPIVGITNPSISHPGIFTTISNLTINIDKLDYIAEKWKYGGMYVAKATNRFGTAQCSTLVFMDDVFLIRRNRHITLKNGQQSSLKCYVISSDLPEITWYKHKDGTTSKYPDTHMDSERLDKREIFIKYVQKDTHNAIFECVATLGNKVIREMFNVTVEMPPMGIKPFPAEVNLDYQSNIEAYCSPTPSVDTPWYSWWEFQSSHSSDNMSVIIKPTDGSEERIKGLSVNWRQEKKYENNYPSLPNGVPEFLYRLPNTFGKIKVTFDKALHMAIFTCVVQNNVGSIRRSFRTLVTVIEFQDEPLPKAVVKLGETLILNCSPKPNQLKTKIIWSRKNIPLPSFQANTTESIYQFTNGTLIAKNVTDDETLEFLCLIKLESMDIERGKLVKVFVQVPARIVPMPDNIEIVKKSSYNLTCRVYGDTERLEIEWYREDGLRRIHKGNVFKSGRSEGKMSYLPLQFSYVTKEDAGRYICRARNIYNSEYVEEIIQIEVVAVPEAPFVEEHRISVGPRNITIAWDPPQPNGNKPIVNYLVVWRSGDNEYNENVTSNRTTIKDLRPNRAYNVSVRARNDVGLGDKFEILLTTKEDVPDGPVLDLHAVANSSTSIIVLWKAPNQHNQNGRIVEYEVCYRRLTRKEYSSSSLDSLKWTKKENFECKWVNDVMLVLTSIPKFTGYVFRVRPKNTVGLGPSAMIKESTLEDYPELAPVGVTCTSSKTTSVRIQWNPPSQVSINGILFKNLVKYFRVDHIRREPDRLIDNVMTTSLVLDSLVPYSNYSVQVAVANRMGIGPFSTPVICITKQDAPSPPETVRALRYNDSCYLVVWTAPLRSNGVLSRYCIQTSTVADKENCMEPDNKLTYFKQLVCGLNPEVSYSFNVTAYTISASVPASSGLVDNFVRPNAIVSIPRQINVTDGSTVILDCETINTNSRRIWTHYTDLNTPGRDILSDDSNYRLLNNGSMVILSSNYSTNGIYRCKLSEKESMNYTVYVKIVRYGTPDSPQIYYKEVSIDRISFSWKCAVVPRQDDPIATYQIRIYKYSSQESIFEDSVPASQLTFEYSQLMCGSKYTLQLQAVNRAGPSVPAMLDFRTVGSKPLWANGSSLLFSAHSTALCFWLGGFSPGDGCPADQFTVTLHHGSVDMTLNPVMITNYTDIQTPCNNISKLNPATDYLYKITASNNAGTATNKGQARTLPPVPSPINIPSTKKDHSSGLLNIFSDKKFYIFTFISVVLIMVVVGVLLYFVRRNFTTTTQVPPPSVNNDPRVHVPPSVFKDRKLPALPNTYDSGREVLSAECETDEELQPYSTYTPGQSQNARANKAKLGHSYMYPNLVGSQQPSTSSKDTLTYKSESYNSSTTQPLLPRVSVLYNKGYSRGTGPRCSPVMQPVLESINQESYDASGSMCSNTTSSSAKELSNVFKSTPNIDPSLRLRTSNDDSHCSTARPMNSSTRTMQPTHIILSDDINSQSSYFDSGSSVDAGIQRFTQDRCPGIQAVEPRFTNPSMSSYPRTNDHPSSMIHRIPSNPGPFQDPSNRYLATLSSAQTPVMNQRIPRQGTLTEEDESNNFQNNTVIV